jgi:hypothetical protein
MRGYETMGIGTRSEFPNEFLRSRRNLGCRKGHISLKVQSRELTYADFLPPTTVKFGAD